MHNRENGYYWVVFSFILFIISYVSYLLAEKLNLWSASLGVFACILILILIIIPVTKYLSDQLIKFILVREIHNKSSYKFVIMIMIIIPIAIISTTFYNEYKEKNLTTLLGEEPTHVESLEFRLDGSEVWRNNSEEVFNELFDFLNQYQVKKISDSEWNSDVSKETSFKLTVYTESDIIIASVHEDRLSLLSNRNGGYYSVLNGPINIEWITNFNQKYD